jgi:hypothetical protein
MESILDLMNERETSSNTLGDENDTDTGGPVDVWDLKLVES